MDQDRQNSLRRDAQNTEREQDFTTYRTAQSSNDMVPTVFRRGIYRTIRGSLKRFLSIVVITALGVSVMCGLKAGCEDLCDCCLWHFRASAWYGQQGERFVAVDHRRCIRMPFVPPCLMYNLSILQKRCATNGSARQKLGKRYERRKTHGLKNISICVR